MNREMKCRAWHKDEGKFLEVNKLYICDGSVMCVQDINEYEQEIDPPLDVNDKNLALVWYTGLKDKNGVEIYEGDILEFWGRKFLVVYNLGGFGCFGLNEAWHPLGDTIYRPMTVIGNRFENPELLDAKP